MKKKIQGNLEKIQNNGICLNGTFGDSGTFEYNTTKLILDTPFIIGNLYIPEVYKSIID